MPFAKVKYLLLQVRDPEDTMRHHEVECFADKLQCPQDNFVIHDLISGAPTKSMMEQVDCVLVGGSGKYSVVTGGDWFPAAMDFFRQLHDTGKPTFASCWGFQAFAKALGGDVVTDLKRAEVGTHEFHLSQAGMADPVFGPLGAQFLGQCGHQDIVESLPGDAVLLASSRRVQNQAFTFEGKPIYGTQFHPELERDGILRRLVAYPEYIERITGLSIDDFIKTVKETPGTGELLLRFVHLVFG